MKHPHPPHAHHHAIIECGVCSQLTRIRLGLAAAICCPACKTEIVLGEAPAPEGKR